MIKSAINGADRPPTNNVLEQLLEVINHSFDFRKKISINMELMQLHAAQMATYGILIGIPQLTITLLANIKTATKSNYGREFCLAMHIICKKYTYNHLRDATLPQGSGRSWRCKGPQGCTSTGHGDRALGCQISVLPPGNNGWGQRLHVHRIGIWHKLQQRLVRGQTQATRMQAQEIQTLQVARRPQETEEGKRWQAKEEYVSPLQKVHRKKPHQVEPDKCMWNKKYNGYHFKSICNKLEVAFKPRHKYSKELGGYASEGNKSGDNWRCAGTPEDGEKDNDDWITITGNGKTKNLLNSKPNPKVHNAFAILSHPNAPTHYNTPRPTQQINDDKTIIPPGPWEHRRQQKFAQRQHIKKKLWWLHKSDDLFLDNSITQAKDDCTAIAKNDTNSAKRIAINSAHAQCN